MTLNNDTVVICMATYNGMKFLGEQIESIQSQTHQDWKLLIHDDGSTDGTRDLIAQYHAQDPRIELASNSVHLGIKRGSLETLTLADGAYYAFSDQDDLWHDDKLERLIRELQDSQTPTLAYSKFNEIDAEDKDITDYNHHPVYLTELNRLILTNTVTGCTCMFNKALRDALIAKLDGFNYDDIHMHDWWAAVVAVAIGEIHFVDERLISYRQHGNNVLGAPHKKSFFDRLGNFFAFHEKNLIRAGVSQAALIQQYYGQSLDHPQTALIQAAAKTLTGWNPLRRWQQLKKYQLLTGSHFMNLELFFLLWMPAGIRHRVLS